MPIDWKAHTRRIIERLGEDATMRPANGAAAYTVRGIFASPYTQLLLGAGEVGMAGSSPRFAVMSADVPNVVRGDVLELSGSRKYRVTEPEHDEVGGYVVLRLEK